MKSFFITALLMTGMATMSCAQDQTVNGHLYLGAGHHVQVGYGKRINFMGNSDNCYITQFNVASNQTEFRFNIGDDLEPYDKMVIGVTWAGDGQWYPRMVVQGDGNVGIGTNTPQAKLEVSGGDIKASGNLFVSSGNATGGVIKLADDGDIVDMNDGWATHRFAFGLRITNGNATGTPVVQLANGVNNNVTYFDAGNVGIGTSDPKGFKLAVAGSIGAESVTVKLQSAWPDYVFKPAYRLPSLETVKAYIDKNQHLPEMPSEAEVAKDGVNLGEINKLLLKKVEELTLYLIERDKMLKLDHKLIGKLAARLKNLEKSQNIKLIK